MTIELLNRQVIVDYMTQQAPWSGSHGADGDYLGMGLLYYAIVYILKAEVAVCLGSGGGFVPRLMRQAQRDLGIAATSKTILVDGNYAKAGWGTPTWLAPGSFFKREFDDIEIIIDMTRNAAMTYFKKHSVHVNYLHIDADHSFQGCLEDIETYWPFLGEGSIVTLHDTNLPGAGVMHVVEHIRTFSNCELIDFNSIGAGTAVVRIGSSRATPRLKQMSLSQGTTEELVRVVRRKEAQPIVPPEIAWKYLESAAFSVRYVLAAHFVHTCRAVIEIGGAKTPIDQFLTGVHDSVLVLDPFIRESHSTSLNGRACRVSHVRARFQDVDWQVAIPGEYGLVMLGLELQGLGMHDYAVLYNLVNHAKVTVIEFPTSWSPSREQFELIKAHTQTQVTFHAKLDLEGNDFGSLENSWPARCDREVHVLEPW
jgi:Methyltransferase domain